MFTRSMCCHSGFSWSRSGRARTLFFMTPGKLLAYAFQGGPSPWRRGAAFLPVWVLGNSHITIVLFTCVWFGCLGSLRLSDCSQDALKRDQQRLCAHWRKSFSWSIALVGVQHIPKQSQESRAIKVKLLFWEDKMRSDSEIWRYCYEPTKYVCALYVVLLLLYCRTAGSHKPYTVLKAHVSRL